MAGLLSLLATQAAVAQPTRQTPTYQKLKAYLDRIPAIDTHDHLVPFERLPGYLETAEGKGMNLAGVWRNSYFSAVSPITGKGSNPLPDWEPKMDFDVWWQKAKHGFNHARSLSVYRYQLPAFQDLYGIDFEQMTDDEARTLNQRIFENYKDQRWLYHVVTERANIELMLCDPWWGRYTLTTYYPFEVLVLNVNPVVRGFHPSEFPVETDDLYLFAKKHGLPVNSLDDYLQVIEKLFLEAKDRGAVCLKHTLAYNRTLQFDDVPKERAEAVFGKRRSALTESEIKDFEDYMMWRLVEFSARFELPFQMHTGHGRLQGSNPMLLLEMIQKNPNTKFLLFHGGFPWTPETGAIALRHRNVWIDSVWLPTLSYSAAKRAFHEWLEQVPSNRILWGADCNHAEGIYGATEFTRRCLAEVLAEKVDAGDLLEEHAEQIGRQILRENALALFPELKDRLWKDKGKLTPAE